MNPTSIKNWRQFSRIVRNSGMPMLSELPKFNSPVLITGCQRSGTTVLASIFFDAIGFFDYRRNLMFDSELDGALILSGIRPGPHQEDLRYCFQTTYLNERFYEYFKYCGKFKLVFVLRNPMAVVYSMLYNWKSRRELRHFPLNELFLGCGFQELPSHDKRLLHYFGLLGFSRLKKACLSYNAKIKQALQLRNILQGDMIIVNYDDLVTKKNLFLSYIFDFVEAKYDERYGDKIHSTSVDKSKKLSNSKREYIKHTCYDTYLSVQNHAISLLSG